MKISERGTKIQASPIRKLKPFADDAVARGIKIYHLNIGQPDIATPPEMINVYRGFHKKVLAYGPAQGLDDYRTNLVNYYRRQKIEISADDIIVTTAGSEGIIFAMLVCCNPGDEIIIPEPFYTNYNGFATISGVRIVPLTTHAENGFQLPPDSDIIARISARTRAILLCNPGNPTGAVYSCTDLERVAEIARKNDLFLITDEVYREFIYDGLTHTSVMHLAHMEERAVLVDSISKRYSACGARIGCLISRNRELMAAALKFAQARLCPPTIDQMAANAAIDIGQEYFDKIIKEYDKRRNVIYQELQKIPGIICVKPQGAFYIIAKLPIRDSDHFARWMLSEFHVHNETVMFAPAAGFYATPGMGSDEIRLAYVLKEESLLKAMSIFRKGLAAYIQSGQI
ncbi:MAG: pyridoxal phosphate-dependent aminotransferase [Candidatus Cloacimonetes bacterium]|nr:pyridoxal phosphate-dependent aminotransferase [Candidatus Cloacimonadota bacterium]